MRILSLRDIKGQILSTKYPISESHLSEFIYFVSCCIVWNLYDMIGEFSIFHQIKEKRFFFGKWFTVIFLRRPLGTPFLGLNMFTWRPTLIFLVRAPCGNTACTWGTTVLLTTPPKIKAYFQWEFLKYTANISAVIFLVFRRVPIQAVLQL